MAAHDLAEYALYSKITDISTAESVYVTVPFTGRVVAVYSALEGAITVADADIVVTANGVACGTITIATASSAAGDIDSISCDVDINAGETMLFAADGGSTDAQSVGLTAIIDRS